MLKKLIILGGVVATLALALFAFGISSPVVFVHYAAAATKPVAYIFNDDSDIVRGVIYPGTIEEFRTAHRTRPGYSLNFSLPDGSQDDVNIDPPFSRVDVYIGADTKITRTVVSKDFLARLAKK